MSSLAIAQKISASITEAQTGLTTQQLVARMYLLNDVRPREINMPHAFVFSQMLGRSCTMRIAPGLELLSTGGSSKRCCQTLLRDSERQC
eukprot:g22899.t1